MTSHELANKLLELKDKPIVFVTSVDGPYHTDCDILGEPWEDLLGCIRIQTTNNSTDVAEESILEPNNTS